ncbi:ergothioneine biosynthesis protein EgtB [Reichenbachiella carrageenanivorans]|uniref:Ergothioneine biosynthesis protein EgtB n=1 Tax=Reichenbachiella carrageenanivorans TaxID=2979869 RepID=A0ABY6D5B2_9BACT|nr:ergothioneine biosynthesis protein EgtB [Reichenbachiella carrageenanivorans]UXX81357.1 ergothioneine biosynthesis protein EgtB [Reichenbachiella carrageenanivorans]
MSTVTYSKPPDSSLSYFKEKYQRVRNQSLRLCAPLEKEDMVVQPVVDVSPPKWHLGHTTWFFEKMILETHAKNYQVYHPEFNFVFNSYYESIGKRVLRTDRGNLTRPTTEEIYKYRAYVDEQMLAFLNTTTDLNPEIANLLELGLQHEQQHQELLVYDIKYILGNNPLFPAYTPKETIPTTESRPLVFLPISAGNYTIGHQQEGFCFDNELGVHQVYLHDYEVGDRLITNGEYLEFIEAGGYQDFRHWYMEGWAWVQENKETAPMHWHQIDNEWHQYTFFGLQKLNLHEPVTHVSHYEAAAFAQWKGMRLPTEFEWEVACRTHEATIHPEANFIENAALSTLGATEGHYQFYGDVWEWTNSAYLPYPFFKTKEGAIGEYNGKFMINQMVLKGGSFATPKDHVRSSYRNFFHPQLKWHFTGIRLAKHV